MIIKFVAFCLIERARSPPLVHQDEVEELSEGEDSVRDDFDDTILEEFTGTGNYCSGIICSLIFKWDLCSWTSEGSISCVARFPTDDYSGHDPVLLIDAPHVSRSSKSCSSSLSRSWVDQGESGKVFSKTSRHPPLLNPRKLGCFASCLFLLEELHSILSPQWSGLSSFHGRLFFTTEWKQMLSTGSTWLLWGPLCEEMVTQPFNTSYALGVRHGRYNLCMQRPTIMFRQ